MGRWWLLAGRLWLAACCLWLAGCNSLPREADIPLNNTPHTIYFIYQGWHTSLLLEAEPVRRYSRRLQGDLGGQNYLRIGWGDGDYFTGKSKTFGSATRALFVSDYSAIQVLTYWQSPLGHIPADTRVPLALSERGFKKLVKYLDSSLQLDERGQLMSLRAYQENTGNFYRARDSYSLVHNCNTWSSIALQRAGLPVRSRFKLTAQSVFEQARAISQVQQARGALPPSP